MKYLLIIFICILYSCEGNEGNEEKSKDNKPQMDPEEVIQDTLIVSTFLKNLDLAESLVTSSNNTLISSSLNGNIIEIFPNKQIRKFFFHNGIKQIYGGNFNNKGEYFFSDHLGNKVCKRIDENNFITLFKIEKPLGMTFDPDNNLYVLSFQENSIYKYSPDSVLSIFFDGRDDESIYLDGAHDIYYKDGFLYTTSLYTGNFCRFDINTSKPEVFAKIPGSRIGYIKEWNNRFIIPSIRINQLFQVSYLGVVTPFTFKTDSGMINGGISKATFKDPNGIATSLSQDILYISDQNNTAIRIIKKNEF